MDRRLAGEQLRDDGDRDLLRPLGAEVEPDRSDEAPVAFGADLGADPVVSVARAEQADERVAGREEPSRPVAIVEVGVHLHHGDGAVAARQLEVGALRARDAEAEGGGEALARGERRAVVEHAVKRRPAPAVIAMSGHASPEEAFELARAGARRYLAKPIALEDLMRSIEEALADRPDLEPAIAAHVGQTPMREVVDRVRDVMIDEALAREHGSRTRAAKVLGVTRQAVQQRFHAPHKRYGPETMTEDLRAAMTHVKRAAVQHRNNYIGTEHLLWGLTAEPNSATRLLRSTGLDPSAVHRAVGVYAIRTTAVGDVFLAFRQFLETTLYLIDRYRDCPWNVSRHVFARGPGIEHDDLVRTCQLQQFVHGDRLGTASFAKVLLH